MRHVMAIADDELFARVKASAARAKRTVQGHVEVLLAQALKVEFDEAGMLLDPVRPSTRETGTPVAAVTRPVTKADLMAPMTACRSCGHEARKHEPACVMMGCPCRKFS